ncbi:MAG: cysteine--tRNA ligase [Coriobacteriia bacterium]|nr:cysteine--tRNA ligase [Coriobacteriia bacterium]
MTIRVHDTLSRAKRDLVTRDEGRVSMYVCGPTVYNHIHIGNARTFLTFDVIRRYLEYRGYEVDFVQNITDIDDKIIARAAEEGIPAEEVAAKYTMAFLEAMDVLGVAPPTSRPRATRTIREQVAMIERLIEGGHAYAVDGDVYFSVRSFRGYGELSGRDIDELESGARVDVDARKADPQDFALWKAAKPGEPSWESPWGRGRPGWHLECSAMAEAELGKTFDIHGGASDLIFPHHENERAQSEAAFGVPFVRYWLHGGLLQVNAEKMSKSLGNFMLLKEVLSAYRPQVVRLLMLQTHYRSPLDFSPDRLDEAKAAWERLENLLRNLRWARGAKREGEGAPEEDREGLRGAASDARAKFEDEMDDDFNAAGAVAAVFELARAANVFMSEHQARLSEADVGALREAEDEIGELLGVLGVDVAPQPEAALPYELVDMARDLAGYSGTDKQEALAALLAARAAARTERHWAAADAVRDGLASLGFVIEDTPGGSRAVFRPEG